MALGLRDARGFGGWIDVLTEVDNAMQSRLEMVDVVWCLVQCEEEEIHQLLYLNFCEATCCLKERELRRIRSIGAKPDQS